MNPPPQPVRNVWRALIPVILFVLFGAWTADAIKGAPPFLDWFGESIRNTPGIKLVFALVLLAGLCATAYWLHRSRSAWGAPARLLDQRPGGEPRKVLVVGLSKPSKEIKGFDLGKDASIILYKDATGDLLKIHSLDDALENMQQDEVRHNWQQSLRAVNHHAKEQLKLLVVVPSSGNDGSGQHTEQFKAWMNHYKHTGRWKNFDVETVTAANYEHFKELQDSYIAAIRLAEKMGFKESDVVIDVTAGQKTTSIAAAMVTLTTEADFQYIQTAKPFEPITYSVVSESRRDLE